MNFKTVQELYWSMYLVPILWVIVLVASVLAWSFKKCRRNYRSQDKCNSHDESGNEQETRNTQSVERPRQPKPDVRKLQALEAKVRSLESQLEDKEKENLSCRLTRQSGVGLEYRVFHKVSGFFPGRAFGIQG
ncbi:MAG: hypothetical protein ACTSWN_09650 [Promethearchaeota archaeon]